MMIFRTQVKKNKLFEQEQGQPTLLWEESLSLWLLLSWGQGRRDETRQGEMGDGKADFLFYYYFF